AAGPATLLDHAVSNDVFGASDDHGNAFLGWSAYQRPVFIQPIRAFVARLSDAPAKQAAMLRPSLALTPTRVLAAITPNQSRGPFLAPGAVPTDAPARAELIDLRGRVVASRLLAPAAGGAWIASFGASEHLASGTYVLRVTQANTVTTAKVSVLR